MLLVAPKVWDEITGAALDAKQPAHAAMAYFGANGDRLLPLLPGSQLVVDASIPTIAAGGTSPAALARLKNRGVEIYSAQYLHAKVVAFDRIAFVGSANASAHSSNLLIEAVLCSENRATIRSVRNFVKTLCITSLSSDDLRELSKYYRPPKVPGVHRNGRRYSSLIMDLTLEQGGDRITQVQPPRAVWRHYFGINVDFVRRPTLKLTNFTSNPPTVASRRIVKHHHTFTIEILGAELPRPAILQMRRTGPQQYSYWVHRPGGT